MTTYTKTDLKCFAIFATFENGYVSRQSAWITKAKAEEEAAKLTSDRIKKVVVEESVELWPDYATESLEKRLAGIKGLHLTTTVERINSTYDSALETELGGLRRLRDEEKGQRDFWTQVGNQALTNALADELHLAKFRAVLESEEFAYATHHHLCPDSTNLYGRDEKSPTGVHLLISHHDCPEVSAMLAARKTRTCLGGLAGNGAPRY